MGARDHERRRKWLTFDTAPHASSTTLAAPSRRQRDGLAISLSPCRCGSGDDLLGWLIKGLEITVYASRVGEQGATYGRLLD